MFFRVNNKQTLKNYSKIWEKSENLIRIGFESKPVYGDDNKQIMLIKRLKIFPINKMPKEKSPCKFLSIIMLDSVIKVNKKYCPQTFLEECKYLQEKIKTQNYIHEDLEKSESDSDSYEETESDIDNDEYDK